MNDEIKTVITDIFSANDVKVIEDMLEIVTLDLDKNVKSKRLSQLRDIINRRLE